MEKLIENNDVEVVEEYYGDKKSEKTIIKYIMDVKTKVMIIITIIVLFIILITGGVLITGNLYKKIFQTGKAEEVSVDGSQKEEIWTSQNLYDKEYYYYPTQLSIRRIRRDTLDYKTVYLSPKSAGCQIDPRMVTIYGDYIYFFETNTDYSDSSNTKYDLKICKVDKNGEEGAKEIITKKISKKEFEKLGKSATSEAFFYVINDKMYKFDFKSDSEEVYAEGEELPTYFEISEDNTIYFADLGVIYKIENGKPKKVYEDKVRKMTGYKLIKQGDNIYFTGGVLGLGAHSLQYYSLKDKEVKEVEYDEEGLVFNRGNMIYLYGDDNIIYKLNDEKWVEFIKLNGFNVVKRKIGDIAMLTDDMFMVARDKDTHIYNFKEGKEYVYGVVNEENATKESYVENKLKSTKRLKNREKVQKFGTVVFAKNSENEILNADIGENISYNTNQLQPFCTKDEMLSVMGEGEMHSISELDIYDRYCYWVASIYDENYKFTTAILKKKCDGAEKAQVVKKIEGKLQCFRECYYYEGGFMLITSSSVYKFDYESQQLTLLYTLTIAGRETTFADFDHSNEEIYKKSILFLDKELVIKNPVNGRFYTYAYDGSYSNVELFDKSYDQSITFIKYVNYFLYYYTDVKDNYLIFYQNCKINLDTGKVEKLTEEDL